MRMMAVYYGKPVILLIDEYDVPLAKASTHGYYQEMLEVMRAMMSTCLKDNRNLSFAGVTGCLRIAKESIFTGTNKMERSDVVVSDSDHDRAAVFEVKMVREKEKLESACTAALDQIREQEYAEAYSEQYSEVRCYGIAFYKKECLIKTAH